MTFCYTFNQETGYDGEYETREAALAAAVTHNAELIDPYTAVWTAQNGRWALGSEFLTGAAPLLIEYARDDNGEAEADAAAPEWLEEVSLEAENTLEQMIKATFDVWCAVHGHTPRLWHVTDVVEHEIGAAT